jgi:uncharacterized membrane protein YphA (DoxX/SURF4 family)
MRCRRYLLCGTLALLPTALYAHERFIKHNLRFPMHESYFYRQAGMFLGMQPDMFRIGMSTCIILFAFLVIFFFRQNIDMFIEHRLATGLHGRVQEYLHHLATFLTDKPVRLEWFHSIGQWAVVFFMRTPALVLMYAASNDSLVMPSYPLEPSSATIFKYIQVLLAIMMLTQTALPLVGAVIFGTWIYLFRYGWYVTVDALPVLTVAVLYITSPWNSFKLAITEMSEKQVRWVRLVLGFAFFALGWMKIYNYHLTAGVADNYPDVLNDPLIGFFTMGTNQMFRRENWVIAFALSEVLSGFLLMMGIFTRIWASIMLWVLVKLMLFNFGWGEIPHIYPVAATLAVIFSNRVGSEFSFVEKFQLKYAREGKPLLRYAGVVAASAAIALATVYLMLYALTFSSRAGL